MADYDFRSLSPYDFEVLCRDLLQKDLGVRLESFTTGRDSGIDFRYRKDQVHLIVQCKHFAETGFDGLARVLAKKERPKIEALKPTRYVLATSVGLTPGRKQALQETLAPYRGDPADILGREDINNLLTTHAEIERRHFKLWLTSTAVLQRILHAGIFGDSEAHLEYIRPRLCRYVPNDSFDRASALLEKTHVCIVAGIPGIGKTTLAEVLLADLVDRQGFSAFRVAHDLSELRAIKNPKSKQVFYFDDFLGKTSLEKLQKNEDQRLVELMKEVAANPNWRFILTTREYILNIARQRYEAFAHPSIDFSMCVINLGDYTRPIRAKILYNHIYFSDLPKEYKLALLDNQGYEAILRHRNYNPRVVEYMTQAAHAQTAKPSDYLSELVESLENPARIWEHAFRHQISDAARHLLWVLTTLTDQTKLELLERAFWAFYSDRQKRFGFPSRPGDWLDALKELDGNFIKTERIGKDVAVSFHNPSIRDFMEQSLANSDADVMDLLRTAPFFEQLLNLWMGIRDRRYPAIEKNSAEYLRCLAAGLWNPSARTLRTLNMEGELVGLGLYPTSHESRAAYFVEIVDALRPPNAAALIDAVMKALIALWEDASGDREDVVRLLQRLTARGLKPEEEAFVAARRYVLANPETDNEFRGAATFVEQFPGAVSPEDRERLRSQFGDYISDYSGRWDDEPDALRQMAADVEYVGERLDVDASRLIAGLYERADEIETERAEPEPPDDDEHGPRSSGSGAYVDDVQGMFNGLADDLKND